MKLSKVKVEQINNDGEIVSDYGEILTRSEIMEIINDNFSNSIIKDNLVFGTYNNEQYCIVVKNVSYLGKPHPVHKKRIQIPESFKKTYFMNKNAKVKTLLIGVYSYRETLLFCNFDTQKYVNNKINNSSAHVHTIDLYNGFKHGFFSKKDIKNNIITVFDVDNITAFLDKEFLNIERNNIKAFDTLDEFFFDITKEWYGMEAYLEMITDDYKNKYQPEWPGFYLEYKLEKYLNENKKTDVIKFCHNKKKGEVDLDIIFPQIGFYGDLKTHSIGTGRIIGNDFPTIMNLLEEQSVYYIVVNHETKKDKDNDFVVTKFWNKQLGKENILSYSSRMKHSINIKSYFILELNKFNKKYIDVYNQGKNSDGNPRVPKIMISIKNINNFLVHRIDFVEES